MTIRLAISVILIVLISSACAPSGPDIQIIDPWVRATAASSALAEGSEGHTAGSNSAAYMVVQNSGRESDFLVATESEVAEAVEIHISEMKDDVMIMQRVDNVDIPPKGQVELKPGGLHIMLIGIQRDLNDGETITLTLNFLKSGPISAQAEVRLP